LYNNLVPASMKTKLLSASIYSYVAVQQATITTIFARRHVINPFITAETLSKSIYLY